jgi:hypothetical protein
MCRWSRLLLFYAYMEMNKKCNPENRKDNNIYIQEMGLF